ncbi:expressed unknown protein [Seminavis robusta]|uniref:Uncharacterized protein n=1 Tax=Seminavis robusta TaxID=568900 RepID=A0A9N8HKT9_9STRA|nr:expressed unknown protein [Seminavis robusta]|eukprot:Sro636_g179290.1 n/a (363) ;mRNA; r:28665-29753
MALLGLLGLSFQRNNLNDYVSATSRMASTIESSPARQEDKGVDYQPSKIEQYIISHMAALGLDKKAPELVSTCHLWNQHNSTPYHKEMHEFVANLEEYYKRINEFSMNVTDLRQHFDNSRNDICDTLELHKEGLPALFPNNKLSYTRAGWVEPLLPPQRHPNWCIDGTQNSLASIEYLIHDFGQMCRQLKPNSRTVLFDMGASLMFSTKWPSPVLALVALFRKFGIPFDHIYAYEMTKQDPQKVFEMVPDHMSAAYHWINVGVDPDPQSKNNPFNLLLDNFNEDDLVIVKLDIDTPWIEQKLAHQLLADDRLLRIIDHFYFEHHVNQKELAPYWGRMGETVEESLTLFQELRKKGVASHFWT